MSSNSAVQLMTAAMKEKEVQTLAPLEEEAHILDEREAAVPSIAKDYGQLASLSARDATTAAIETAERLLSLGG